MHRVRHQFGPLARACVLVALVVPLHSQQAVRWRDTSSHAIRFIDVNADVRLEVLDWGGAGRPLVLVPGGGDTAHVFDEFALRSLVLSESVRPGFRFGPC